MKRTPTLSPHRNFVGTSRGSAAFYVGMDFEFGGDGFYEDDLFVAEVKKGGKLDKETEEKAAKKKKKKRKNEENLPHPNVALYYGNQFFAKWYLK